MQVFVVEAAHTFGLCLFVFKVLPQYDIVRALLLMCATSILPAFFKLFLTKGGRGPLSVIMDLFALLMQSSVFFLMTLYHTRHGLPTYDLIQLVELASSLLLISLRYWENFVDRDVGAIPVQSFKQTLRLSRCKIYIFASLWKIALTLAFAYLLIPQMTPMADIFRHIGNETAYDNKTNRVTLPDHTFSSDIDGLNLDYTYSDSEVPGKLAFPFSGFNHPASLLNDAGNSRLRRDVWNSKPQQQKDVLRTRRQINQTHVDHMITNVATSTDLTSHGKNYELKTSTELAAKISDDSASQRTHFFHPSYTQSTADSEGSYDQDYYLGSSIEQIGRLDKDDEIDKILYRLLPLIIHAASGAICYYFSRVACKLCMQGFSFSLPLTLITPATAAIFCYLCYLDGWTRLHLPDLEVGYWKCSESYTEYSFHWQIGCALSLWWLSQLWVNNHIWFPQSERLAKVERYE